MERSGHHRNFGSDRNRFDGGSRGRFRDRDSQPREMHKAVCAQCNVECEVPFKPAEGRPVFCKDCHRKRREESQF